MARLWPRPARRIPVPDTFLRLPFPHADRGPRTAGGAGGRRRAGGGAGRQGAPAPGPAGRRRRRASSAPTASSRRCGTGPAGRPRGSHCRPTSCGCAARSSPTAPRGSTGRYVVRRGTGYALAADRTDVDALQIVDLAARGRARLRSGDPPRRRGCSSTALALWRGEPYGDWPDASFADAERRRLAEVRTGAVDRAAGGPAGAGRARRRRRGGSSGCVAEDPLQEEWWRLLVLALYRGGRQGDALAARGAGARGPRRAAGRASPDPRLRAMEAAVLAQDPALDLPAVAVPARQPPAARTSPPARTRGWPPTRRRTPRCSTAGAGWSPAWWAARRRAAARGVRVERRRQVLARPGRSGPGARRRRRCRAARRGRPVVVTPGRGRWTRWRGLTGDRPAERAVAPRLRPVRGAVGARNRPRRNGRRSSTRSSDCSTTGSSSGASRSCGATTSAGWPSTRRSPNGSAVRSSSSRHSPTRSCARSCGSQRPPSA